MATCGDHCVKIVDMTNWKNDLGSVDVKKKTKKYDFFLGGGWGRKRLLRRGEDSSK